MQWPCGRTDAFGFNPYSIIGNTALAARQGRSGADKAPFSGETWARTSAKPDGYSAGGAYALPVTAGGMSSWQAKISVAGSGALIQGGPMEGAGSFGLSGEANMALTVGLSGNGSISITGAGGLALTISLSGDGSVSFAAAGGLSLIVPIAGSGSFSLAGAGDLRGNLSMEGSWGGSAPLSPEGLAQAVWSSLASGNNAAGTMGELLNNSGAGVNPWTVTLEGSYTAADLMRIMAAVLAGKVSGGGTAAETFRSVDDSRNAVVASVDEVGNRTAIALDP